MMDVGLEVLIPLAVLLCILIVLVVAISCRFFLWRRIKRGPRYTSLSPAKKASNVVGYPQLPSLKAAVQSVQTVQYMQEKQRKGSNFSKPAPDFTRQSMGDLRGEEKRSLQEEFVMSMESDDSVGSSVDTFYSDVSWPQYRNSGDMSYYRSQLERSKLRFTSNPELPTSTSDFQPELYHPPPTRRQSHITPRSSLLEPPVSRRRSSDSTVRPKRSFPKQLVNIGEGQIHFSMLFNIEKRSLDITIKSLVNINLAASHFIGVLPTYSKDDKQKSEKRPHLVKQADDTVAFGENTKIGYMVYLTLLPKRNYKQHTQTVIGARDIDFNETFSLEGYTNFQADNFVLCFHALCTVGEGGEPMVLGEAQVPVKRVRTAQELPFKVNLTTPREELKLIQNSFNGYSDLGSLSIQLNYNPMAHKLFIKIIKATGLPKIGVTGHPNTSVKTSLYFHQRRESKKRTSIQKRQRDPTFMATVEFDLSKEKLSECDLVFELSHHGPMYRTNIGYVHVGSAATSADGERHWLEMLDYQCLQKDHKILPTKPIGYA